VAARLRADWLNQLMSEANKGAKTMSANIRTTGPESSGPVNKSRYVKCTASLTMRNEQRSGEWLGKFRGGIWFANPDADGTPVETDFLVDREADDMYLGEVAQDGAVWSVIGRGRAKIIKDDPHINGPFEFDGDMPRTEPVDPEPTTNRVGPKAKKTKAKVKKAKAASVRGSSKKKAKVEIVVE
jgi:hypothetical protein